MKAVTVERNPLEVALKRIRKAPTKKEALYRCQRGFIWRSVHVGALTRVWWVSSDGGLNWLKSPYQVYAQKLSIYYNHNGRHIRLRPIGGNSNG